MDRPRHYLLAVVFPSRIAGYLLTAVLLALHGFSTGSLALVVLGALLAIYPLALHGWQERQFNSAAGARRSMLLDAVIVGIILAAVGFDPWLSLAVLVLLAVSTVIIAGITYLLSVVPLALLTGFVVAQALARLPATDFRMKALHFGASSGPAEPSLPLIGSLLLLASYFVFVATMVFNETRTLRSRQAQEQQLRRNLEAIRQRIRPFVAPQLLATPGRLPGSYQRRRLTVFFSDIEGFTHLMDTRDETEMATLLGDYFGVMNRIAQLHGGTLDKFIGDGVMVFFGDPESRGVAADAHACIAMAMDMRDALGALASRWRSRVPDISLHIRIGIHTGYCLVGCFGGEERMEYTALGSTVNLASRLEGSAGRDEIMISAVTCRLLAPWIEAVYLGKRQMKGFRRPVGQYRVTGLRPWHTRHGVQGDIRLLDSPATRVFPQGSGSV